MLKAWISAARLKTLPLSLAGIIMGTFAAKFDHVWNWLIFALALITTLCFQVLSNFANDLGDSEKGTDNEDRLGPMRAVQSGLISQKQMKKAVKVLAVIGGVSAVFLIIAANFDPKSRMSTALIVGYLFAALLSIAAAIMYTMGKKAYGYRGLGDVFVFLFFGIVGVVGSYGLFSKTLDVEMLLPAITIGLMSAAVLNLNNMRDIENDRKSGKNTIVVMLGAKNSKIYHYCLLICSAVSLAIFLSSPKFNSLFFLTFIPFVFVAIHIKKVMETNNPQEYEPELKKIALSTFFVSLIFAILGAQFA